VPTHLKDEIRIAYDSAQPPWASPLRGTSRVLSCPNHLQAFGGFRLRTPGFGLVLRMGFGSGATRMIRPQVLLLPPSDLAIWNRKRSPTLTEHPNALLPSLRSGQAGCIRCRRDPDVAKSIMSTYTWVLYRGTETQDDACHTCSDSVCKCGVYIEISKRSPKHRRYEFAGVCS
jgi:hypothetical protein